MNEPYISATHAGDYMLHGVNHKGATNTVSMCLILTSFFYTVSIFYAYRRMSTWNINTDSKHTQTLTYAQTHFTSFLPSFHVDFADANTPLTHCHPHICAHTSNITSPGTHTETQMLPPSLSLFFSVTREHTHTHHRQQPSSIREKHLMLAN